MGFDTPGSQGTQHHVGPVYATSVLGAEGRDMRGCHRIFGVSKVVEKGHRHVSNMRHFEDINKGSMVFDGGERELMEERRREGEERGVYIDT